MHFKITENDGRVIVKLCGDLYVKSVAELREEILQRIEQGKLCFTFDMSELQYIDSAGLGVMITFQKRVLPQGGGLTVRGLHGVVKELFEQTRLDKVFIIE